MKDDAKLYLHSHCCLSSKAQLWKIAIAHYKHGCTLVIVPTLLWYRYSKKYTNTPASHNTLHIVYTIYCCSSCFHWPCKIDGSRWKLSTTTTNIKRFYLGSPAHTPFICWISPPCQNSLLAYLDTFSYIST